MILKERVIEEIKRENIPFNVISGRYRKDSLMEEYVDNSNFVDDLDIVVYCEESFFDKKMIDCKKLKKNSQGNYTYTYDNNECLCVDVYFTWLSSLGFRFCAPKINNNEDYLYDEDYLSYLLIDPLMKFGQYKIRHLYQINCYKQEGVLNNPHIYRSIPWFLFPLYKNIVNKVNRGDLYMSQTFLNNMKVILLLYQLRFPPIFVKKVINSFVVRYQL